MRSLREMQIEFARGLLSGVHGLAMPGLRADGISPAQRLGFYRANVLGNYLDALRATYCSVEGLIGRGCFAYYAERFIRQTPSLSGDLNRYGGEFAQFLAASALAAELPYLADVARLEWALEEVFYEADHAPLDLHRLEEVPAHCYETLRFTLHPACRLLHSEYPLRRIWEASRPGYTGEVQVSLDEGADRLLLRREGFEPLVESVGSGEFAMLCALRNGECLASACAAGEQCGDFDAAAVLQHRLGDGTFVDFVSGN